MGKVVKEVVEKIAKTVVEDIVKNVKILSFIKHVKQNCKKSFSIYGYIWKTCEKAQGA